MKNLQMFGTGTIGLVVAGIAAGMVPTAPALAEVNLVSAATLSTAREMTIAYVRYFIEPLNRKGKGRIHINFRGGPEVMPPNKQAIAVGRGALDMTHSPGGYYDGSLPECNLVRLSNLTPAEIRKNGAFDMLDRAHQTKMNIKFLAWGDSSGTFNIYLTKKPVMKADGGVSLKGYRMRSTATYRPILESLGAVPVAMPAGDIYTALQRGVIQGFGQTSASLVALGIKGLVKYRIDPSFYRLNNYILMNLDKWKALPQSEKDLVNAEAQSYEAASAKFYSDAAKGDEKAMMDAGMSVIELKGAAAKRYVEAANKAVIARITKGAGKKVVDAYLPLLMK